MNDAHSYQGSAQLVYGRNEKIEVPGEATLRVGDEPNTWSGTFRFDQSFDWDAWNVIYGGDPDVPARIMIEGSSLDVQIKSEHGTHSKDEIELRGEGSLPG